MASYATGSQSGGKPAIRIARALASPRGVVITIPLLVICVGLGILLLGRDATRTATSNLVERQLSEQVKSVQSDVAFALDQATPLMARTRVLALGPELPLDDLLLRLHDLIIGRPGVSYVSISFPDGRYVHAYAAAGTIEVHESKIESDGKSLGRFFTVAGDKLVPRREIHNAYDPRKRPFWALALKAHARTWTQPYTFEPDFDTGITCTEPVFDGAGTLRAVLTVDFDIKSMSSFVARPTVDTARTIVYTGEGTVLAYPAKARPAGKDQLLDYHAFADPALDALFAQPKSLELQLHDLDDWFTAVAPIGGRRGGVDVPLDWYVATIIPKETLLGPTRRLERTSAIASAIALAIAVGLALVLAWNLVRMRRQVAVAREDARVATERAKELGSYRLTAKLGSGGMGEVWRAEHRMLARSAAIKLIRPEALRDPDAVGEIRERFRREAQTLASMKSRNTIELYDYGVTEAGVFYYVMELLDGIDLESLIVRYGAQPPARVIQILIQACASLAEAHDAGLLHRDIKPPNLFIARAADEVDIVKLLDFGIVQAKGDVPKPASVIAPGSIPETPKLTAFGAMVGTPGFMAPEQILGMELDGRADLYALGCCAWWLLVGEEVFRRDGTAHQSFLNKHIHDPIPSLRIAIGGWCPPQLEAIVAACLAKDPDQRPANARELADRLRAIPIPAEHAWTAEKAQAWWADYEPPLPIESVRTSAAQLIMPGNTAQRPESSVAEEAFEPTRLSSPTIEG